MHLIQLIKFYNFYFMFLYLPKDDYKLQNEKNKSHINHLHK